MQNEVYSQIPVEYRGVRPTMALVTTVAPFPCVVAVRRGSSRGAVDDRLGTPRAPARRRTIRLVSDFPRRPRLWSHVCFLFLVFVRDNEIICRDGAVLKQLLFRCVLRLNVCVRISLPMGTLATVGDLCAHHRCVRRYCCRHRFALVAGLDVVLYCYIVVFSCVCFPVSTLC